MVYAWTPRIVYDDIYTRTPIYIYNILDAVYALLSADRPIVTYLLSHRPMRARERVCVCEPNKQSFRECCFIYIIHTTTAPHLGISERTMDVNK